MGPGLTLLHFFLVRVHSTAHGHIVQAQVIGYRLHGVPVFEIGRGNRFVSAGFVFRNGLAMRIAYLTPSDKM